MKAYIKIDHLYQRLFANSTHFHLFKRIYFRYQTLHETHRNLTRDRKHNINSEHELVVDRCLFDYNRRILYVSPRKPLLYDLLHVISYRGLHSSENCIEVYVKLTNTQCRTKKLFCVDLKLLDFIQHRFDSSQFK